MTRLFGKLSIAVLMSAMAAGAFGADKEMVKAWVLLSEPPAATSAVGQSDKQNQRIKQQQDEVMTRLNTLGATELARVTVSRNALAIEIDRSKLPQVKNIPGVRSVSPVRHIEREPPEPSPIK